MFATNTLIGSYGKPHPKPRSIFKESCKPVHAVLYCSKPAEGPSAFSGLSKHGQKNKFHWHVPLIKVFSTFSAATYNSRSRNNLYGSHFRIKNVRRPFADLPSRRCSPRSPGPLYVDSGYPGKPPDLIDDRTTFHRRQYAP